MGEILTRWARLHGALPTIATVGSILALMGGVVWFAVRLQSSNEVLTREIRRLEARLEALVVFGDALAQRIEKAGQTNERQEGRWTVLDQRMEHLISEARITARSRGSFHEQLNTLRDRQDRVERDVERLERQMSSVYTPPMVP